MVVIVVDIVWVYGNVVFYLSYKVMELYGFEYWMYFLFKWVGFKIVGQFVNFIDLVLVLQVKKVGLIDDILLVFSVGFVESVIECVEKFV